VIVERPIFYAGSTSISAGKGQTAVVVGLHAAHDKINKVGRKNRASEGHSCHRNRERSPQVKRQDGLWRSTTSHLRFDVLLSIRTLSATASPDSPRHLAQSQLHYCSVRTTRHPAYERGNRFASQSRFTWLIRPRLQSLILYSCAVDLLRLGADRAQQVLARQCR
jgi:hypothetical protein